jgi:hypothetical protein
VFCYRHAVEIALKQVIEIARRYLGENGGYAEGHVLADLSSTCKPLLRNAMLRRSDRNHP